MKANLASLGQLTRDLLSEEAQLLTSASDWSELAHRYADFVAKTPGYPEGGVAGLWDPVPEITSRRVDPMSVPYCLLTGYYANLYFGIRQAVELDSLRYAIDQLDDELEKSWAMGTLVVTASAVATTYGGHFAQPPAPADRLLKPETTKKVLARRHLSATREFEIRLLSLSSESEKVANRVETLPGPWAPALDAVTSQVTPSQCLLYLDAPYRREEYSRFYHVLETLVTYAYPSAHTAARIPRKGPDRFASEFFTRNSSTMTRALATVLQSALERGFSCAWSYADRADANPLDVLDTVAPLCKRVRSVTAEHDFKRQGRSKQAGRVREYLFLLESR